MVNTAKCQYSKKGSQSYNQWTLTDLSSSWAELRESQQLLEATVSDSKHHVSGFALTVAFYWMFNLRFTYV